MDRRCHKYGNFYWCVGTADENVAGKPVEVYVMADRAEIEPSGSLVLRREDGHINLAFAPEAWRFVYAASLLDGSAVAVEHWPGQITES